MSVKYTDFLDFRGFIHQEIINITNINIRVQIFIFNRSKLFNNSNLNIHCYYPVTAGGAIRAELKPIIAFSIIGIIDVIATAALLNYSRRADHRAKSANKRRIYAICLEIMVIFLDRSLPSCVNCGSIEIPECDFYFRRGSNATKIPNL
jgi:hypothetical protein